MFVRFRETGRRLQVSLVETRRDGGKVRHEHVAMLGSVGVPAVVAERLAFWEVLHQRLSRLSNRVNSAAQGKIMGAVHARIPMVLPEEVRALQLKKAEEVERQWSTLLECSEETLAGHKAMATNLKAQIADGETAVAALGSQATRAKERISRLQAGESVAGIDKPLTAKELIEQFGFTASKIRHMQVLAALGDEEFEEYLREVGKPQDAWEHAVARSVARRRA